VIVVRFWNDGESHHDVTEKYPFVSCSRMIVNTEEEAVPEEICAKALWKSWLHRPIQFVRIEVL
jgi:hypothetical protein